MTFVFDSLVVPLNQKASDLNEIIRAAIDAVRPEQLFPPLFERKPFPPLRGWLQARHRYLLAVGKAAGSSVQTILNIVSCDGHFLIAPSSEEDKYSRLNARFGSHPIPDERSQAAASSLLMWLDSLPSGAPLLVVLSGGASALMIKPKKGLPLEDKMHVNRLLIHSGAGIDEINCVRKHLSGIKGGQLAYHIGNRPCHVLVFSDVIEDDLSTIGSGPFYPDATTFADTKRILEKYDLYPQLPQTVVRLIEEGLAGALAETPKQGDIAAIPHYIVASNEIAREAAARKAAGLGYPCEVVRDPIQGLIEKAAKKWESLLSNPEPRRAIIAGGEITIHVQGAGTGGRNQHLALLLTRRIAGAGIAFAAAGTDGIDGNSPAAGAWTDGTTFQRTGQREFERALQEFDSFHYFSTIGQTIVTGPTGTNVMDLYIALT